MPYPSSFDNLPTSQRGQAIASATENAQSSSINAIESTLGLNPQGGFATVAAFIAALLNPTSVPVGGLSAYAGPSTDIPSNYMLCDGQSLSQTAYSALYAVLSTTYGGGSGNFNLPDMRGRIPLCPDGVNYHLGTANPGGNPAGGEETHPLALGEIPGHNHTFPGTWMDVNGTTHPNLANGTALALSFIPSSTTSSAGGSGGVAQGHNNIQPFLVLNYIIRVQ